MSASLVVTELRKNASEVVRVTLDEFNGRSIVSVRVWFRPDGGDELRPGKAGIAMSVSHLPALSEALNQALSIATEQGLIDREAR